MMKAGIFCGLPRELRTRCNMRSIYGQSCKHASECYAGIAARVLRVAHVVEMKESRPSTRPPTRLSQAVRDHGGAGQLDPRRRRRGNARLEVASDQDRFLVADSVADFSCQHTTTVNADQAVITDSVVRGKNNEAYWGESGHDVCTAKCPLLTQSGHHEPMSARDPKPDFQFGPISQCP